MKVSIKKDKKNGVIVVLGSTGDLSREKIFPALESNMSHIGKVIGFGRRDFTDLDFRNYLSGFYKYEENFLDKIDFHKGTFDDIDSFSALNDKLVGPAIFYVAISPNHYVSVINSIKKSALYERFKSGDFKIAFEKPLGLSEKEALVIHELLSDFIDEKNVYYVDHYLFKNKIIEIRNDRLKGIKLIEERDEQPSEVYFRHLDMKTLGTRGESYDNVGAFIDVGQNHLLQEMATFLSNSRISKQDVLGSLVIIDAIRGQYDDYKKEGGVKPVSETETYFKVELKSMLPTWKNTDFFLEAGKALYENASDIVLGFYRNDREVIKINDKNNAYNKVLHAIIIGDKSVFPTFEEIKLSWKIAESVKKVMEKKPLKIYKTGSVVI